jgi:glyoxylase-like metal-dependent hydrolase (beta-lactamase superfamily II)
VEIIEVVSRMARCQLVLAADGITLVDAGADPNARAILAALGTRGLKPQDLRRIVLTHGDGDHIGGVALLQAGSGADVVAHELELAYIAGRVPPTFPIAKRAFGIFGRRLRRPTVTQVVVGPTLQIGDLEAIHTPGHTPGHLVVLAGAALLAGDALRTGEVFAEVPAPMTVDRRTSRDSIRLLSGRDIRRAYSGHGQPADDASRRLRELVARLPTARP